MTVDLYKALGVSGRAGTETIRKAYRSKAKKAHPDAKSGSRAAFDQVKLAHDILTDPAARARYDATGEIRERAPDAGRGPLYAVISSVLSAVLAEIEAKGIDPASMDMVACAANVIDAQITKLKSRIAAQNGRRKSLERISRRFRGRKAADENVMQMLVEGTISSLDAEIDGTKKAIALTKEALAVVKDHVFEQELSAMQTVRFTSNILGSNSIFTFEGG
jgi:DnaJ-class molecular chaperone